MDPMTLRDVVHAQCEPASELALEAVFARERGDVDRSRLLVEAAFRAWRRSVREEPLGLEPAPLSAREVLEEYRCRERCGP